MSTDNFLMKRHIEGETWAAPVWTHCMEIEFQLRRDAMKLCREQGYSIQAALWATYRNQEHRMKHWVTLLSIANSRSDAISDKAAREIEQLKRQVAQLQRPDPSLYAESKVLEKVLEVIPLFSGSTGSTRFFSFMFEQGKGGRGNTEKEKSSSSQSWVQGSPQAQQNETGFLLPVPKQILYKTELQAAS